MAGLSSISGLIAGFDTKAAVDELLGFRKFEIAQLESKQSTEVARQEALQTITTSLSSLRSTAVGLADADAFFGYTASLSSDSATVTASTLLDVSGTSAVSAGQHSVVVEQLAYAQRLSSSSAIKDSTGTAATTDTGPLNLSGTFTIEGVTITVSASDSLQDIAGNINQANSGASATGVSASVIKVADSDYRLILAADDTGSTGFTLAGADLDAAGTLANLQLGSTGEANQYQTLQAAQDAQVTIDGLTVTRSSNQITDLLSGITFDLKQADPTVTVNMSISVDKDQLRSDVQAFVDAYNELQALVNEQFTFDANTGTSGLLAGESLLTSIQRTLTTSLLQSVSGLASDRNSMVMIGVEPDENGQLFINEERFAEFLNNDPEAIRDVLVAQGSSTNNDMNFVTYGLNTVSGTYSVDVTTPAARASLTGTADLSVALAADETVTITETSSSRQAIVNLTSGQTQSAILSALNTEFQTTYTEQHQLSTALTAGGSPATGSNTFDDLALGVSVNDTITIAGTLRSGVATSGTYTVLDPASDTLSGLLSAIQSQFNQQVIASLDGTGKITLTDVTSGDSLTSITLTANNEGAGTLAFGSDTVVTEGRYAMNVEAVASGNNITLQSSSYGSSAGFSITQSVDGLGIADTSASGTDIAGTINGLAADGTGTLLMGSEGLVEDLAVSYTGSTATTDDMVVGVGLGAALDGLIELYSNPVTGLMQNRIESSQDTYDDLTLRIATLTEQMERQRAILTEQFIQMESLMNTLNQTGSFLTQQIDAKNSASN